MIEEALTIINKHGLHARPAAQFVKIAGKFKSDIKVLKDGLEVNGKSIMGVMMLAASKGTNLILRAEGNDCKEALDALEEVISNGFGEEI